MKDLHIKNIQISYIQTNSKFLIIITNNKNTIQSILYITMIRPYIANL